MPLSEHEQQMLREMEEALYAEDPRFASQLRGPHPGRPSIRRLMFAGLGVIVGLVLIVTAVLQQWIWLGAIGFAVMVATVASAAWHRGEPRLAVVDHDGAVRSPRVKGTKNGSFMQRLERRWDRRREDDWR